MKRSEEEPKKKSMLPLVVILLVAGGAVAVILIVFLLRSSAASDINRPDDNMLGQATELTEKEETVTESEAVAETEEPKEEPDTKEAAPEASAIHRYELVISDASWKEAFQECIDSGGYLAHVDSEEEYAVITSQIRSEGKTDITFWIGASRDNPTGTYRWINPDGSTGDEDLNSPEKIGSWLPGEPSNEGDGEDGKTQPETCVDLLYRSASGHFYWNDVPEDVVTTAPYLKGKFGYICEYEDAESTLLPGTEDYYKTLILGDWSLPGSNRMYMSFSPDGTVFGYEYIDDSYWIEGDTLIIDQTYTKERLYFTIVQLDGTWLGLAETDSTGRTANAEDAVYGYRNDSPEWYTDPALEIEGYGNWVLKDMTDDGLDGLYKGLYFNNGYFEMFIGDPDLSMDDNVDWTMAATVCPGALIARDGKMDIYFAPGETAMTYEYRVEGDSLFVRDAIGEHEFYKHVNQY